MKRVFARITAAILAISSLNGCAPETALNEKGSIRVLVPAPDAQGKYQLEVQTLEGIENLEAVSGQYAHFYFSPRVNENKLVGDSPKARFIRNNNGEYVPMDDFTQQLATIYLHMQKLAKLDDELGIPDVNAGPRDVGVGVRATGAGSANNAFYYSPADAVLLVPYTLDGLPIPINGGILAHEHFHSLFKKMAVSAPVATHNTEFLKNFAIDSEAPPVKTKMTNFQEPLDATSLHKYYRDLMEGALNEGLADYWGWLYTGDPDFIVSSLPLENSVRSLETKSDSSLAVPSEERIFLLIRSTYSLVGQDGLKESLIDAAYKVGTQYSRVLKRYADIHARTRGVSDLQARKEVAKLILKTLPQIGKNFEELDKAFAQSNEKEKGGHNFTANHLLQAFAKNVEDINKEECEFLASVMNASKNISAEGQIYCQLEDGEAKFETKKAENLKMPKLTEVKK